jgi:hypothetical protein
MSLPARQQRLLREIDDAACRSDPQLASMLAVFAELTAGEQMPGREQLQVPRLSRARAALMAAALAGAMLIIRAVRACGLALRSAAAACIRVATRLARRDRPAWAAASPGSPVAGSRTGGQPGPPGR